MDKAKGRLLLINLILAALYFGLAKLGLLLALPPGYATAIWPPAGLAFAACIVWGGRNVWPGILLGSVITNATIGGGFNLNGLAFAIAVGSTVQALIGEAALRRADPKMELEDTTTISYFIAVTLLTCVVAAAVGNASLFAVGFVALGQIPQNFFTWWLGDTLGVLIFLPLTLILVDPRPLWRNRRVQVGVPLLASFLLSGIIYNAVKKDDEKRLTSQFELQTAPFIGQVEQLDEVYFRALTGLSTTVSILGEPTRRQFSAYVLPLLHDYPLWSSVAWLPLVRQEDIPKFERAQTLRAERTLMVTPVSGRKFSDDGWLAPIALIEPFELNKAAFGRDLLSEPVRASAFRKAWQTGQFSVTEKIKLVQDPAGPGALLLIAPVKAASGQTLGFVSGVIDLRNLFREFADDPSISWSLRDETSASVMFGALVDIPDFKQDTLMNRRGIYQQRLIKLADRNLRFVLHSPHSSMSKSLSTSSVVLFMALLISAGLGMFTLVMSANTVRVARLVSERTRQLREEIDRREQGEQVLRESEGKFRTLVALAPTGIYMTDAEGQCIFVNSRWCEMADLDAADALGSGWINGVHADDRAGLFAAWQQMVDSAGHWGKEYRFQTPAGQVTWVFGVAAPQFDAAGEVSGYIGVNIDITESKRVEQMKTEFVSTVSHELRTPLTSISGSLGLITGGALGELPAAMKPMLDIAHKNSLRLTILINDLLDMEKLVAGKMDFDFQRQLLMPLIEQSIESTRAYGEQYNVTFVIDERADAAQVLVDASRLQQVLANFMSNAAKYSPVGDKVSIKISQLSSTVRVEVIDRGPGIPDEFRGRIFQKFSQADSSDTRQKGGTGLGLAISKELIERMSGTIGFSSEPGKGSCFYFELPLSR